MKSGVIDESEIIEKPLTTVDNKEITNPTHPPTLASVVKSLNITH